MKSKLFMLAGICWILVILALTASAQAAIFQVPSNAPPKVTLSWDYSLDTNVIGYYIYLGGQTQVYTNRTTLGKTNITVLPLAQRGIRYYFTATAFNARGEESLPTNEATWDTPPLPLPPSNLRTNMVQLSMKVESGPTPQGPWSMFATLGTEATSPGFFRSVVQITGWDKTPLGAQPPPIPGQ